MHLRASRTVPGSRPRPSSRPRVAIPLLVTAVTCFAAARTAAQSTVVDINRTPGQFDFDSNPTGFATVGANVYFAARSAAEGEELWITNGTRTGTRRFADINSGPDSSSPAEITAVGRSIYFVATTGLHGRELWKSVSGGAPQLVADLYPGAFGSGPAELTLVGDDLWFAATTGLRDRELIRLDTRTDTWVEIDLNPSGFGSLPTQIRPYRTGVVFTATDAAHGREVFRASGNSGGIFADINPGPASSLPTDLVVTGSTVFFIASSPTEGREIWRKSLLGAATLPFDLRPGSASSEPQALLLAGSSSAFALWFFANDGTSSIRTLWKYEPLTSSTPTEFRYRGWPDLQTPSTLTAVTGRIVERGFERHVFYHLRSDPDTDYILTLLSSGDRVSIYGRFSGLRDLVASNGRLQFLAGAHGSSSDELFVRTIGPAGTNNGTFLTDTARRISTLSEGPGYLMVGMETDETDGIEPHRLDYGTQEMRTFLGDANPGAGTKSSSPTDLIPLPEECGYPDTVVFTAAETQDSSSPSQPGDRSLFASDGSLAGTRELFTGDGQVPASIREITVAAGAVYFVAENQAHGSELYVTRGDAPSTRRVADLIPGAGGSDPALLTAFDGRLFFRARDQRELWATDGTVTGTVLVDVVPPGSTIEGLASLDEKLLILVGNGGTDLWTTNGQPNAATMSVTLSNDPAQRPLTFRYGDKMVIGQGTDIHVTDGTRTGTATLPVWLRSSRPEAFAIRGGTLYFAGQRGNGQTGTELWVTDGTVLGTREITDIAPNSASGLRGSAALVATDDTVFFMATDDGAVGRELWRADAPAPIGVRRVTNLDLGPGDSVADQAATPGTAERLLFSAGLNPDGSEDREIWISNGLGTGTMRLEDVRPGPEGSNPRDFTSAGNRLFFVANDGLAGEELRSIALRDLNAPNAVAYGNGCATSGQLPPRLEIVGNPETASTVELRTPSATAGQPVLLFVGLLRMAQPIGFGCSLLTSSDVSLAGASNGTFAAVPLAIPNDPVLAGASIYTQMARIRVGGPALGVAELTHGLRLVLSTP